MSLDRESLHIDNLSTSNYARRRSQLMQLIKQLRAVGAQADVDLPRIAVIGNQSAGKSSLVEAISGITVPRDSGTCTRCPMECRLATSSDPWYCQVSLRFEYDEFGKPLKDVREILFGPGLSEHEKDRVELVLRRAQTAILNPHVPHTNFLDLDVEELKGFKHGQALKFSRNVVCLDISGPEQTDLSFVDLPGIIQNDEPDIVRLVEDLVVTNIKGNCLILVALPMTDDIENQKAARLAKQEDQTGRRTIGVLTKPDYLTSGSTKRRQDWLDVIEGRVHRLKHGYFVTRQPDDDERAQGITSERARQVESEFFDTHAPWNMSMEPGRFGTRNLTATLSKLLTEIIDESLPALRSEVHSSLEKCRTALEQLPRPVDDPSTEVLNMITWFSSELKEHANGLPGCEKMVQTNRATYHDFKVSVRRTVPRFYPFKDKKNGQGRSFDPDSTDDSDGEESIRASDKPSPTVERSKPMYLKDMRKHIKSCLTWELPGNVPYHAKTALISNITQQWQDPAKECFHGVADALRLALSGIIDKKFSRFKALEAHVRELVFEEVRVRQEQGLLTLEMILKLEGPPLFTQNTHYNASVRDKWLAKYKSAKRSAPAQEPLPTLPYVGSPDEMPNGYGSRGAAMSIEDALASLAKAGYNVTRESLAKLAPVDEYEEELGVMADVRAYFQVAYKRVIDYVPLAIEHTFVRALVEGIQGSLIKKLRLGEPDSRQRCALFLNEDQNVVLLREELEARRHRLEQANHELLNFGGF
ncbi:hypothetical protein BOTBODRAFT_98847 [Botryobasidium botryosum FD-172 SS1]|uniref:GED domain-containing protein n=1 Tax=Botryobasidium botryosum (strain FD-172 SS1) TaxID=930990 RepID=A0A067N0B6_BOTB1|nr:hypothetical protein BOTBODRAFT_98847 [Botryobasidium botryosum FD-172 SS1]